MRMGRYCIYCGIELDEVAEDVCVDCLSESIGYLQNRIEKLEDEVKKLKTMLECLVKASIAKGE